MDSSEIQQAIMEWIESDNFNDNMVKEAFERLLNSNYTTPMKNEIKLVIDNETLQKYNSYYFKKYPKRKKEPIETPTHPSINKWFIMKRPQMNDLKQKYKDFITWFVEENNLTNKKISKCNMTFISFFKTKIRKDVDNTVPKFILDGFVESGLLIDDDSEHLQSLTLKCGYDKENPRLEIYIQY